MKLFTINNQKANLECFLRGNFMNNAVFEKKINNQTKYTFESNKF